MKPISIHSFNYLKPCIFQCMGQTCSTSAPSHRIHEKVDDSVPSASAEATTGACCWIRSRWDRRPERFARRRGLRAACRPRECGWWCRGRSCARMDRRRTRRCSITWGRWRRNSNKDRDSSAGVAAFWRLGAAHLTPPHPTPPPSHSASRRSRLDSRHLFQDTVSKGSSRHRCLTAYTTCSPQLSRL